MSDSYSVYWIKRKEHSCVEKDGYIGITKNVHRRIDEHRKHYSGRSRVSNAIKKYDDIEHIILFEGLDKQEAIEIEKRLRPDDNIGWNITKGGGLPPSNKGLKKPKHSDRMKGEKNPFYGKTHTEETKAILSSSKTGDSNPFYGKKRPDHSEKMKSKNGKNYPKFRGYFLTPIGNFESYNDVCEKLSVSAYTVYKYCLLENETPVTKLSYAKSKYLKENFCSDIIGKTYKELGFGFEYV